MRNLITYILLLTSVMLNCVLGFAFSAMQESTNYAPHFSESKFDSLKCGMDTRQVLELLGPPLEITKWDANGLIIYRIAPSGNKLESMEPATNHDAGIVERETWSYSKQADKSSYKIRVVEFSSDGMLLRTDKDLYVD